MINKGLASFLLVCTATVCLLGSITHPVQAATLPAGFSESIVFSGLTSPTAIRFSPDERVFVAEKSGLVKVFANLSATTPTVFHDLRTNVHNFWDRGLMGLDCTLTFPQFPLSTCSIPMTKTPIINNFLGGERLTSPPIRAPRLQAPPPTVVS